MTALVSVVIPCYNYADYLPDAVESVLSQRGVNVEVIIVDDCSTDASGELAQQWAHRDQRIRVLRHVANTGPVQTFNDGLTLATGEFLVRLDADDLLTPGSLRRSVDAAQAFPNVGMVYGRPLHFTGNILPEPRETVAKWTVWPGEDWLALRCRSGVNVITSPEVLMRKSVVDIVGGQRPLAHAHDMEMWLRLAAASDVVYIHGADQAWHREHPRSLSLRAQSPVGITILEERRQAFAMVFANPSLNIPNRDSLKASAEMTLAAEALERAAYEFDRGRATSANTRALIAFARHTYPGFASLPAWKRLERRMRWGDEWLRRHPWHLVKPLIRMTRDRIREDRWRRTGLYERC